MAPLKPSAQNRLPVIPMEGMGEWLMDIIMVLTKKVAIIDQTCRSTCKHSVKTHSSMALNRTSGEELNHNFLIQMF